MTVSHKKSKGGSGAGLYYIECLENGRGVDDYFSSAKEPPGVWYVGGTRSGSRESRFIPVEHGHVFGSDPAINDAEAFKSLVNGVDPLTKEPLIGNAMSPDRIAFHDFTCSAPKSVSVVWSQANDELAAKILKAQEKSADAFLDHISDHAYYRYGKGSVNNAQSPIRAVKFEHGSARSIDGNMVRADPQIHTHCVVLNMLESQHNDRPAYALETKSIMAQQGVAASLYHAKLAWEMRELGFEIEKAGNLFEIAGVPQAVMKDFSQRREQIEAAVKEKLEQMGLDGDIANASRGMFRAAALESRNGKGEISRIDLQAIWKERGQALGFSEKEVLALMNSEIKPELTSEELKDRIREVITTIQNTDSVFRKEALQIKSLVSTYGDASPDAVMSVVDEIVRTELLQANLQVDQKTNMPTLTESTWYTTPEMLITERQMLDLAGKESDAHIIKLTDAQREQMSSLKAEQMRAVEHVLGDRHSVSVVEGTAGAGKTFTMKYLSGAFREHGYQVTGLATAWTAANNLKNEAGLDDFRAITGFLKGVEDGSIALGPKSVLILDEAGMSGSKSVHAVLQAADRAGAKVVLLGDTQQQKSVTAGDPLRMIVQQNGSARLDVITRQRDDAQRAAVPLFFNGKAREAIKAYENQGKIHIQTGADATQNALVARWIEDRVNKTQDQIILALDRDSVSQLNAKAHEAAKVAGLVDGTRSITVDAIDNKSSIEFCVGDRVQFRKNDLNQGITNRSYGRVVEIQDEQRVLVETDAGRRVLVDANDERWQVEGKLGLTHGYATTVYSSQGVTVDRSYVLDHLGLHRAAAGVALSRHRDDANIFIDKEARYLAKMKLATPDEWHPIEQMSHQEVVGRAAHSYEANREKLNGHDFTGWADSNGAIFNTSRETEIVTRTERAERALQQSRQLLNDIRSMSSQALLDRVDRMPAVSQMAFERSKRFELKTEFADSKITHAALMRLGAEKSINEEVLAEAVISGFVRVDKSGEIKFIGRDASGRNVSQQGIDDIESKKPRTAICNGVTILTEAGMRDRYPPVLPGTPDNQTVDVVKTGLEALALRSLQETQGLEKTTIVVAKDREAFAHTHVRELMMQAKDVRRHDKTDVNLVEQNKQIQAAYEPPPPKREEEITKS